MRQAEMKAKAKAMALEARLLKAEEKRERDHGRVRAAIEKHTDIDDLIGRLQACGLNAKQITRIRNNMRSRQNVQHSISHYAKNRRLHEFRVNVLRPQVRLLNLARGYLAGKAYRDIEPDAVRGFDHIWLASVLNLFGEYGEDEFMSPLCITDWVNGDVEPRMPGWEKAVAADA